MGIILHLYGYRMYEVIKSLNMFFSVELSVDKWPSDYIARLPIKETWVQDHKVAPKSTQHLILLRSVKCVPGTPGNLVVKSCKAF